MRYAVPLILICTAAGAGQGSDPGLVRVQDGLAREQLFEARRASSSDPDIEQNVDRRSIKPGGTLVLMDEAGPGIITHFWNTIQTNDIFYARSVVVRIYYNKNNAPSVESPLGDFFAVGHAAERDVDSIPVSVTSRGRSRVCYWEMPFDEHIRITITNESTEHKVDAFYYQINWKKVPTLPPDTKYFHARYHQEFPATPGNYTLLETTGAGHYVGTVHSVFQMESGWFGEGDDFFYIDGSEAPQLRGTGTEDYFNDAWGYREFQRPYYGVPVYDGIFSGDRVSTYRWHMKDPIPFTKSLRVEIEHRGNVMNEKASFAKMELGGFFERKDWISSVAFWYQSPPVGPTKPLPAPKDRMPPYHVIPGFKLAQRTNPPGLVFPVGAIKVYFPGKPDGSIEFDLDIAQEGRYRIDGLLVESHFGGVYQPYLNDRPIGVPIDFTTEAKYDVLWVKLDTHDLKAGKHILRFEGTGQNPARLRGVGPRHYAFAVAAVALLRLDDMEGYNVVLREVLEREEGLNRDP